MDTLQGTAPKPTRSRKVALTLALAGMATAVLLSACNPTNSTFDAWKAGNKAQAQKTATPGAVDELFAKPWSKLQGWFFSHCSEVPGASHCNWIDNTEGRLTLKVDTATKKVVDVERIGLGSNIKAGRFFHAYRQGKPANAKPYGSDSAIADLFAERYEAGRNWTPGGCTDLPNDLTACYWYGTGGEAIELRVHDATKMVMAVERYTVD